MPSMNNMLQMMWYGYEFFNEKKIFNENKFSEFCLGNPTPLQRCSWRILQPQPTGPALID